MARIAFFACEENDASNQVPPETHKDLKWTGLKNGWLVKRYYVKSVTELLLSMRVAFSPLKSSIWRTGCSSCFSTGTAILFHFQRTIEVTLDSLFNRKYCLNRSLTSVAFKKAILAALRWRNWISAVQSWIRLHLLMAFRIDLVVWLKFYLPSIFFRGQGMQKGSDLMVAGQ